jgi:lipopolysaccharide export system protein LptA
VRALVRAFSVLIALSVPPAFAEKADRDKPTNIESNRMSSDDARRLSIFEGSVVLTKGTIEVHADRIVVRQDADGFQFATATGKPVTFRQKGEPKGNCEGVWTDGEALRIEIDDRNGQVELFEKARVTRDQDVVVGEYIFLDQRSEFFTVSTAKGAAPLPDGRVRAQIQPKVAPDGVTPRCTPLKPPAKK